MNIKILQDLSVDQECYRTTREAQIIILGHCLSNEFRTILPLYTSPVSAGFPSPAEDYLQKRVSLDELIIKNPTSSFIVQAEGDSMIGAGIYPKSLLVVDRSLEPKNNDIIIASIENEFLVKRFKKTKNKIFLLSENNKYPPFELLENLENVFWGVVVCILNPLRK